MAFTVTSRLDASGRPVEDSYGDDANFTVHDSGALFVTRPDEEVIYAPGAWLRIDKSSQHRDTSAGNYI